MYYDVDERPIRLARYLIENNSTVRSTAAVFGVSKSTVHKDISLRLSKISPALHKEAQKVLAANKSERHLRGGAATKRKYEAKKKKSGFPS